jgi:NitT/TauT family transport system substrate-binding protein
MISLRAHLQAGLRVVATAFVLPNVSQSIKAVSALALGFVALAGCGSEAPSAAPSGDVQASAADAKPVAVKLQLNWLPEPEFGGFYAANADGLFAKEGLAVEIVPGGPNIPAPQLAASGKVEFAIVSGPQVVELAEQGGDLIALFAVYQGNPMGVMVHADSPYETLGQLWESDATVAMEQGLAEFAWLSKTYPGGKLRMVPWGGATAQFAADKSLACQCFITAEPVALELQGIKTRVFRIGESGFDPYNAVVATSRAYYEKNRATCEKFVRACAAGWRAYLDNAGPANTTMSTLNPGMSKEAMDRAAVVQRNLIENDETKRVGLGGMRLPQWETMVQQLVEIGRVKKAPDPSKLFVWDLSADTAR